MLTYQTIQNFKKLYVLYILYHLAFVRDRGDIYLMLTHGAVYSLLKSFDSTFKIFPLRGECHESIFGTSLITCFLAVILRSHYQFHFKVTDLAYTECYAVRGHSVVLLHRLLDVYLFRPIHSIFSWSKVD